MKRKLTNYEKLTVARKGSALGFAFASSPLHVSSIQVPDAESCHSSTEHSLHHLFTPLLCHDATCFFTQAKKKNSTSTV